MFLTVAELKYQLHQIQLQYDKVHSPLPVTESEINFLKVTTVGAVYNMLSKCISFISEVVNKCHLPVHWKENLRLRHQSNLYLSRGVYEARRLFSAVTSPQGARCGQCLLLLLLSRYKRGDGVKCLVSDTF